MSVYIHRLLGDKNQSVNIRHALERRSWSGVLGAMLSRNASRSKTFTVTISQCLLFASPQRGCKTLGVSSVSPFSLPPSENPCSTLPLSSADLHNFHMLSSNNSPFLCSCIHVLCSAPAVLACSKQALYCPTKIQRNKGHRKSVSQEVEG